MPAELSPPPGLRRGQRLATYTSLKVGGAIDLLYQARDVDQARWLGDWARAEGLLFRWIGGGSNLLAADAGFRGLVGRYVATGVEPVERGLVVCEAGCPLSGLARQLARAGWGGLEWGATIPGTVGGAVVNNAGAFGSSIEGQLEWVELLNAQGTLQRLSAADLAYGYRTSALKRRDLIGLVLRAAFRVQAVLPTEATTRIEAYQRQRSATQPRQLSAGSVFANPDGDFAGRLIEAAGLKGHYQGQAQISPLHANFVVNHGGALAADAYALVRLAQRSVYERSGVWLRPEIELFGEWTEYQRSALTAPRGTADR